MAAAGMLPAVYRAVSGPVSPFFPFSLPSSPFLLSYSPLTPVFVTASPSSLCSTHCEELGKAQDPETGRDRFFTIQDSKLIIKPVWDKGLEEKEMMGICWRDHQPFVCPFIHPFTPSFTCLSICPPSVHPSTCLFTCLFVCPSTCLSSIHPGSPAFTVPLHFPPTPTYITSPIPYDSWLHPSQTT